MNNTRTVQIAPSTRAESIAGVRAFVTVLSHEVMNTARNPVIAVIGIGQPLLYLFLFGPLLAGVSELGGVSSKDAYATFVPALFIQLALFGGAFVGISLVTEYRSGALERIFAAPVSRTLILGGKVVRDVLVLLAETLLVIGASLILGFRSDIEGLLSCLGLVLLISVAMSSLSYLLAITSKSEEALSSVFNALLLPIVLLAGVMLPMALAPSWLHTLSRFNPLTYVVDASRASVAGVFDNGQVLLGYLVAAVLAAGAFVLAARGFEQHD
ncbi:ABC transporter permease [Microbacterium trichothecenolyticum]|uniref:Transport permease protein n=1 Tax=Microbacterium trichothecenolyticum TaxID=69370 RepID=A0ABU0TSJ6_MICTR|nr:ABC transporter permease [Microbacterium trichothecenolyticum]MDQ1122643.1 ABC-2 type transport system permease protein [Microbacterium trichothecenolyticum]